MTFGLNCACKVSLLPGFDLVSQWLNLPEKVAACDWLITGEGKFDQSSLQGKGPGTLAQTALAQGKRVSVLAGRIDVSKSEFGSNAPLDLVEISPRELSLEKALKDGPANLEASIRSLT
ncbi:MAG: glycerate kinase [Verrucomicrobiae bacterium]|nr:glycerate kinase [Verrucomicrobiae bacterium]